VRADQPSPCRIYCLHALCWRGTCLDESGPSQTPMAASMSTVPPLSGLARSQVVSWRAGTGVGATPSCFAPVFGAVAGGASVGRIYLLLAGIR